MKASSRRAPRWLQGVAILLLQWGALVEAAAPVLRTLDRADAAARAALAESFDEASDHLEVEAVEGAAAALIDWSR